MRLPKGGCIIGAIAAHADGMARFLERLNEMVLILRKDSGENREVFRAHTLWNWSGRADSSIESHGSSDDRRSRRRIAGYHDGAHAQIVQLLD